MKETKEKFKTALLKQGYKSSDRDALVEAKPLHVEYIASIKAATNRLEKSIKAMGKALERIVVIESGERIPFMKAANGLLGDLPTPIEFIKKPVQEMLASIADLLVPEPVATSASGQHKIIDSFTGSAVNKLYSVNKEDSAAIQEERYVLTVVLAPNDGSDGHPVDPDTDNDIYSPEEVRKAAHWYMENGRKKGLLHGKNGGEILDEGDTRIVLLESYVTPIDIPIGTFGERQTMLIKKGTWLAAFRVNDELIWGDVKSGALNGASIGGISDREELQPTE